MSLLAKGIIEAISVTAMLVIGETIVVVKLYKLDFSWRDVLDFRLVVRLRWREIMLLVGSVPSSLMWRDDYHR
jgi:hypothetical protein